MLTLIRILVALTFVGHRGLNFIWFLWFIFGAVWTMDVKSKCVSINYRSIHDFDNFYCSQMKHLLCGLLH